MTQTRYLRVNALVKVFGIVVGYACKLRRSEHPQLKCPPHCSLAPLSYYPTRQTDRKNFFCPKVAREKKNFVPLPPIFENKFVRILYIFSRNPSKKNIQNMHKSTEDKQLNNNVL